MKKIAIVFLMSFFVSDLAHARYVCAPEHTVGMAYDKAAGKWNPTNDVAGEEIIVERGPDDRWTAHMEGHGGFEAPCTDEIIMPAHKLLGVGHVCISTRGGQMIWSNDHTKFILHLSWPYFRAEPDRHAFSTYGNCALDEAQ